MTPLRRLLARHLLSIQLPLLALLAGLLWWGARSLLLSQAQRDGETRLQMAVQALDQRLTTVEQAGLAMADYSAQGRLPFTDLPGNARLLMPWLYHQNELRLVNFVDEEGRSLILVNITDGWHTREIQRNAKGILGVRWQKADASGILFDGQLLHEPLGFDVRQRPWYREARQLETPRWSVPYRLDPPQNRLVMTWLVPLKAPDGGRGGALGIDLLATDLNTFFQVLRPTPGSRLWLLDQNRQLLAEAHGAQAALPVPPGGDRLSLEGLPCRVLRSDVPTRAGSQWHMVLAIPERDLLAAARGKLLAITAAAFALLLLPIIWGLWEGRRLSREIQALARAADQVGAGIAPQLAKSQVAEFATLGQALHQAHADIQKRNALEQHLQHSQRLETLGTLAGGIAHDVNNHLSAILGQIFLVRDTLPEGHASIERLLQAEVAADNCARTTRTLLAFSRHGNSDLKAMDLNELLTEMADLLNYVLGGLVRVDLDLDPAPLCLQGDRVQLEQVIMNLAVNARDAMPDGGHLSFQTRRLASGELTLKVKDTGTGMSPETLARIFEPFYTTKAVGQGTGLGLALVHGIVHSHHGRLEVESHEGFGTTFSLSFPLDPSGVPLPTQPGAAVEVVGDLAHLRILVVEDETYLRETLEAALSTVGASVVAAANGTEAWEHFQAQPFDCILSDQRMPGCTGMELRSRVRGTGADLPFILSSGQDLEPFRSELTHDPAFRLLAKPFSIRELVELVRNACPATEGGL